MVMKQKFFKGWKTVTRIGREWAEKKFVSYGIFLRKRTKLVKSHSD